MWKIMCFSNLKQKLLRKVLEINTFIMQGCVKLIKSNSKDIYNVQNIYVPQNNKKVIIRNSSWAY